MSFALSSLKFPDQREIFKYCILWLQLQLFEIVSKSNECFGIFHQKNIWNAKTTQSWLNSPQYIFSGKFSVANFFATSYQFLLPPFEQEFWFSFWIQILFENHKLIKSIFESGKTHKNWEIIFSIRNSTTRKLSVSIFLVFRFKQTRNLIYSKQFLFFSMVCEILCCKLFDYSF